MDNIIKIIFTKHKNRFIHWVTHLQVVDGFHVRPAGDLLESVENPIWSWNWTCYQFLEEKLICYLLWVDGDICVIWTFTAWLLSNFGGIGQSLYDTCKKNENNSIKFHSICRKWSSLNSFISLNCVCMCIKRLRSTFWGQM